MAEQNNSRKSFIMYIDYDESLYEGLTDEELGQLIRYIHQYQRTLEIPEIENRVIKIAFLRIKKDLDENDKKWRNAKKKMSEAGKKGAQKHWEGHRVAKGGIGSDRVPYKNDRVAIEPFRDPIEPYGVAKGGLGFIAVNVNVNDNVNDISTDSETSVSPSSFADVSVGSDEVAYSEQEYYGVNEYGICNKPKIDILTHPDKIPF